MGGNILKFLVVFTGGTIGSSVTDGYISTDINKKYQLIDMYHKKYGNESDDIIFEHFEPYTILSENLTGEYISILQTCIKEKIKEEKYDGIIITHGTDSLVYMAAAMGYAIGNGSIPIMFVSSNYVLDDARANGLDNFSYAVKFIKEKNGKGVFVSYKNTDNITYIHRATRVMMQLPCSDNIHSVAESYFGMYVNNIFQMNRKYREINDETNILEPLSGRKCSDVVRIVQMPGIKYRIDLEEVKAVLLDSYHSGTVCFENDYYTQVLREIMKKNIPIFLTGVNMETDYESVKELYKYGINTLPVTSPVAMYMKLWMLCEMNMDIEKYMHKSLAGDIVERKI